MHHPVITGHWNMDVYRVRLGLSKRSPEARGKKIL